MVDDEVRLICEIVFSDEIYRISLGLGKYEVVRIFSGIGIVGNMNRFFC